MIYYFAGCALLGGIVALSVGIFVYLNSKNLILNKVYALLSTVSGIWSLGQFGYFVADEYNLALFYSRLSNLAALFIPVIYLHFILLLTNTKKIKLLYLLYFLSFFLSVFSFTPLFVKGVRPEFIFKWFTQGGPLFDIFGIFFVCIISYALLLLCRILKVSSGHRKIRLRYILFASVLGFAGGSTTFPLVYDIPFPPYGLILFAFYPLIIAYAIIRYHLMDIRVAITRAGIFLGVYGFVLGVPFVIGYHTKSWFIPTFFMFFLATSGPIIYTRLCKKAEEILLSQQRKYQKTLIQAAQGMIQIRELKKLINLIVHIVTKAVRVKMAAIFLLDRGDKENNQRSDVYRLKVYRDRELFKKEITIPKEHWLIRYLSEAKTYILLDYFRRAPLEEEFKKKIVSFMEEIKAQLIIPSFSHRELLGFLALGEKLDLKPFTLDDINIFQILAHQASLAIENCMFLEEARKTQEKIFHAEKLALVGGMAEGLSHQINNRLQAFAAISGDLKDVIRLLLEKGSFQEEVRKELDYCMYGLNKIEKNIIHTAQIIRGILNFARASKDSTFCYFDIREIIDMATSLLTIKHELKEFSPQVLIPEDFSQVYGSPALLCEALFNLLDNAYEAILEKEAIFKREGKPPPEKLLRVEIIPQESSFLIKVEDNGIGIKKENKSKVFSPFFTTKPSIKSGTGLGMYVIQRVVEENHQGKIWFESVYGEGTSFYIELPLRGRVESASVKNKKQAEWTN